MKDNMGIRRFTKVDWYGYAGAERFKNGHQPFMYESKFEDGDIELTMIGDANGIQIELIGGSDADDGSLVWYYDYKANDLVIEGAMRAIIKRLQEFDYACDLSYALDHPTGYDEFKHFEFIGDYGG